MDYRMTRSPLLQTVIYKKFNHVTHGLGFDPVHIGMIPSELCSYLRQEIDAMPEEEEMAKEIIRKGVESGEIIAIEMLPDGQSSFLVRCPIFKQFVDLRLKYKSGEWEFIGVASIHSRPLFKHPGFLKIATIAACVLLLLTGLAIGSKLPHPIDIRQYAKDHGYIVMTMEEEKKLLKNNGQSTTGDSHESVATSASSGNAPSFTFTMQEGMGPQDLTQFLVNNHLVKDASEFNQKLIDLKLDRSMQIGTYTFSANMTEDQILQTIKQGPHA
jgi:hypothetical protein